MTITEKILYKHFSNYGEIESIKIFDDFKDEKKDLPRSKKAIAFISYYNHKYAEKAKDDKGLFEQGHRYIVVARNESGCQGGNKILPS